MYLVECDKNGFSYTFKTLLKICEVFNYKYNSMLSVHGNAITNDRYTFNLKSNKDGKIRITIL